MTGTYSKKLERLIDLVEQEHKAGRLTDKQRQEVIYETLKPLQDKPGERDYFMIGGGISEPSAKACGVALIAKLSEITTLGSHTIRLLIQEKSVVAKLR